jgi:hypothetical protein
MAVQNHARYSASSTMYGLGVVPGYLHTSGEWETTVEVVSHTPPIFANTSFGDAPNTLYCFGPAACGRFGTDGQLEAYRGLITTCLLLKLCRPLAPAASIGPRRLKVCR